MDDPKTVVKPLMEYFQSFNDCVESSFGPPANGFRMREAMHNLSTDPVEYTRCVVYCLKFQADSHKFCLSVVKTE